MWKKAELKEMKLPEAAKKVEAGIEETLAYGDYPSEHWSKICTNNVIERMNREIRRITLDTTSGGNTNFVACRLRLTAAFWKLLKTKPGPHF